ncbi:MAG TPA: fatty acyl-AMP ligase [Pseudonocardiaceae bacterium]|nr:fatty acyl-AMP ligase [Pseudonocardiaceae bacterium]
MSRFVDTLLAHSAPDSPTRSDRGITIGEPTQPRRLTWTQVHGKALRAAGTLTGSAAPAVQHGDAVAVLAADPALIAPAVQGVWLAGGSVTMLHQPTPRADLAAWAADTVQVLGMIGAKLVLLGPPFDQLAPVLDQRGIGYLMLADLDDPAAGALPAPVPVGEDDTALLQLTSGSSADPKAVRITHGNLYANMTAMAQAAALDPASDVMISWLPLFHDMGMVGFLTVPMALGLELVKATPSDFMSRPLLWAELISRHRGTITAAPNFAYGLLARRLAGADEHFDLSSLRLALNGAEPIEPAAVRAFTDAGARFGLSQGCMVCAYGMAEATVGVSFAPLEIGMQVDTVDAEALEARRRAVPAEPSDRQVRAFPRLGPPLPGLEAQVVADDGHPLSEREVGRIRLRGESVTREYLTVEGARSTQDPDGWLDTGDEGYLADDEVVICGRRKDVIIMGGRNIYPTDIERAAGLVDGVRPGNVAAVRIDAGARRESFAVAVESHRAGDTEAERILRKEITSRVVDAVGLRPGAVVVLPPATLPKTPSGKLRRAAVRDRIADYLQP